MPASAAVDIPKKLIPGESILAVKRFDRDGQGRIHIEDFAQVIGVTGDLKYTRANEETVINIVRRFCGGQGAVEQAVKRVVVNILLGNTDAHLKNWSFIFRDGRIELSPAYDIVSTHVLNPDDVSMALRLSGTHDPFIITADRFSSFAEHVGMSKTRMTAIVSKTVELAANAWSQHIDDLPLTVGQRKIMRSWWERLALTNGISNPF